jgi:hypothetical protein
VRQVLNVLEVVKRVVFRFGLVLGLPGVNAFENAQPPAGNSVLFIVTNAEWVQRLQCPHRKSFKLSCNFLIALVRVTYVVALPACPSFCTFPNRDNFRFADSFALDLMDFFFTLSLCANLDLGMLRPHNPLERTFGCWMRLASSVQPACSRRITGGTLQHNHP